MEKRPTSGWYWTALLACQLVLVSAVAGWGWRTTWSGIRLLICLAVALLPLAAAGMLLRGRHRRVRLVSIYAALTLLAIFFAFVATPLYWGTQPRLGSRALMQAGGVLRLERGDASYYAALRWDPPIPPLVRSDQPVQWPPWLGPFTGDLRRYPLDQDVRYISLNSDAEVAAFCSHAARFVNLQSLTLGARVSSRGAAMLTEHWSDCGGLWELEVHSVVTPPHWYRQLTQIRALLVTATGAETGRQQLSSTDLQDIAALPQLAVLTWVDHSLVGAELPILLASPSLQHLIVRSRQPILPPAEMDALRQRWPRCHLKIETLLPGD